MPVSTTITRYAYTGNASTTAFPFSSYANASTDIKVFVDGVEQSSGFTTTGSGSSWTVTFSTAPASGVDVLLRRVTTDTQTTDYEDNTAFAEENIEGDIDKRTARSQEIGELLDYTLKFNPNKAVSADVILPDAPGTDKALGISSTGNLEWLEPSTVAASDSASITYNQGGTGAVDRTQKSKNQESVSVKDFGATGDGVTDDSAAIQAAVTSQTGAEIFFPFGTYYIPSTITLPNAKISVRAEPGTIITTDSGLPIFKQTNHNQLFRMSGVKFTGDGVGFQLFPASTTVNTQYEYNITDCEFFQDTGTYGLEIKNAREGIISFCKFEDCDGILMEESVNMDVVGCEWRNTLYGVNVNGSGSAFTAGLKVIGGTGLGCGTGVRMYRADNCRVLGSMFDFCDNPIVMEGQDTASVTNCYLTARLDNPTISIIKHAASGFASNRIKITDSWVLGASSDRGHVSIYATDVNGLELDNVDITFWDTAGIAHSGCTFMQVTNCKISGIASTGSHDGAGSAAALTDSTQDWVVNGLIGGTIRNTTDGSRGIITANTATTVTATLSGGTDNDWDVSDAYSVVPPSIRLLANTDSSSNKFFMNDIAGGIDTGGFTLSSRFVDNRGFTTESKGAAIIFTGNNTAVVAHGCSYTPSKSDVQVTPTNTAAGSANWWLQAVDATNVTINTTPVAAGNLGFNWRVSRNL